MHIKGKMSFFDELTKNFFILILSIVTLIFLGILSPYYSVILWAIILTVIFYPIKIKLQTLIGDSNIIASLITIFIICLIVFIPLIIFLSSLSIELNLIYNKINCNNSRISEIIIKLSTHLPKWITYLLEEHKLCDIIHIQNKISELIIKGSQYLAGSALIIGKGTFGFTISFFIMLYLLFFLLKDGPCLVNQILDILPLSNFTKYHLIAKVVLVTRATIKGTVIVAVVQGTISGIAFYIVNIDGSVLWGSIMAFLSLVPAVGSTIVWIPVVIYLVITQQIWQSFFILCFFLIIVGLVDNFLRPLLIGKNIKIPDYLILITTLGSIEIYGINGFVIGPLIASIFITCWKLFSDRKYSSNVNIINSNRN